MRILMIMAHPDDEVIFGWPILQNKNTSKDVLCLANDHNNPKRPWCIDRYKALNEVCNILNSKSFSLAIESEFYRHLTRDKELSDTMKNMILFCNEILKDNKYDAIFTHNPIGEYGNIDHILVHIMAMSFNIQIWFTDIFIPSNWMPFKEMPAVYKRLYYHKKLFNAVNDLTEYGECEKIYRRHGCWTWSKPPVKECGVYVI